MISSPQAVPFVPAPWSLQGNGYILMFKFDRDFVLNECGLDSMLAARYRGGFGWVMLVDYARSNAGPYRELLFIPGKFEWQGRLFYSITHIYVSTQDSVTNGRRNWGIPKMLADFSITRQDDHTERIQVSEHATVFADFSIRSFGPAIAATSAILPARRRTLLQPLEEQVFLTAPEGYGSIQPAQLTDIRINASHFPDIRYGRLIAAVKASGFHLTFPEASIITPEVEHAH